MALVTVLSLTVPRMTCVADRVTVPLTCEVILAVAVVGCAVAVGAGVVVPDGVVVVCAGVVVPVGGGVVVVGGDVVVGGGVLVVVGGGVEVVGGGDVCAPRMVMVEPVRVPVTLLPCLKALVALSGSVELKLS